MRSSDSAEMLHRMDQQHREDRQHRIARQQRASSQAVSMIPSSRRLQPPITVAISDPEIYAKSWKIVYAQCFCYRINVLFRESGRKCRGGAMKRTSPPSPAGVGGLIGTQKGAFQSGSSAQIWGACGEYPGKAGPTAYAIDAVSAGNLSELSMLR